MSARARAGAAGAVRSTTVELDSGRTLRALEAGSGDPVVLIHGAMAVAEDMAGALFDALAPERRVIAVDRPGHGWSRRERFEAAPERQAAQIAAGLHALGVERALVVAHSVGGAVGLAMARDFPELVAGLVLLAPIAYPEFRPMEHTWLLPRSTPGSGPVLSRMAYETWDPLIVPLMDRAMFAPQEIPERWKAEVPHELVRLPERMTADGEDSAEMPALMRLASTYRSIAQPAAILSGDKDLVVSPRRHARPLARALPDATLQLLPGLGHMIHWFAAEAVAEAVEDVARRAG